MEAKQALAEIRKIKESYEAEIAMALSALFISFEKDTGLGVKGLDVDMEDITGFGSTKRSFVLSRVRLDVGRI